MSGLPVKPVPSGGSPARRGDPLRRSTSSTGFTLLELLAVLVVAGLMLAVAVPASGRFYASMQYRASVRDVVALLAATRYSAIHSGRVQDVILNPGTRRLRSQDRSVQLPEDVGMALRTAREVNLADEGVIRFYPDGGSSGGDIELRRAGGAMATISVDWLLGGTTLVSHAAP